ncbi:MAG: PD40 domain-containing protein [Gemmatimonadetes bacterium]|nr:PD40 domain-containing protein [Gemmatimonadota bacterium]
MSDQASRLASVLSDTYRIEREIGAGGMATVYLARDLRHNRSVALKVLNPELGAVLGVERFLAEIQVTANLQHSNLLPLFDSGEADGLLFYVMPYVEGESLRQRLEGRGAAIAVPAALRRGEVTGRMSGARVWQAATIVLAAALAGGAMWFAARERAAARAAADAAPVVRTNFDLPSGVRVTDVLVGTTIAVSPAGDQIAFTSMGVAGLQMYVRRTDELAARVLGGDYNLAGRNLTFSPDGRWIAFTEGSILRKISVDGGQATTVGATGTVPYGLAWSASDTIYIGGFSGMRAVPASGGTTVPVPLIRELNAYSTPRFSPDGRRVAITVFGTNSTDIWIHDAARNTFTRLTTEGINIRPEWTPDGARVVYRSARVPKVGIWWQPADGSGPAKLLYEPEIEPYEAIVSPDMKWLVFRTAPSTTYTRDILAVALAGDRTVVPLVTSPYLETMPRLSPDGRWLAHESNEGGGFEVYVRRSTAPGARIQVPMIAQHLGRTALKAPPQLGLREFQADRRTTQVN